MQVDGSAQLLFCENETNNQRLFGAPNASRYVKGAINDYVVHGAAGAVNPDRAGTKVAADHVLEIAAGDSAQVRLRLTGPASAAGARRASRWARASIAYWRLAGAEADQFYATLIPPTLRADGALVMRQALAGLLWGKQYYEYDVHRLGERAWRQPVGSERPRERGAQRAVVPHDRG